MLCNETDSSYKNLGRYLWRDGSSLRGSGHNIEDNVSDGLLVGLMVILFEFGRIQGGQFGFGNVADGIYRFHWFSGHILSCFCFRFRLFSFRFLFGW